RNVSIERVDDIVWQRFKKRLGDIEAFRTAEKPRPRSPHRNRAQFRVWPIATADDDLFTFLNGVDALREPGFGLEDVDLLHGHILGHISDLINDQSGFRPMESGAAGARPIPPDTHARPATRTPHPEACRR